MVNIKQCIAWNREQFERACLRKDSSAAKRFARNISTLESQL